MATPLGHYLVGLAVAEGVARDRQELRWAPWLAAVACAPDLDVLPGLLVGDMSRFHHGISHSLAAAVAFAGGTLAVLRWRGWPVRPRLFLLVAVLYASHSALDGVTMDNSDPRGMPLLWPWVTTAFQSPWLLLPNVQHSSAPVVSTHNAVLMAQEAALFVPLVGLVRRLRDRAWTSHAVWLYAGWFLAAVGLSVSTVNAF
jgi:membrane-bound metal-dependent hydrolase YbcI (DUF457 family)